MILEYLPIKKVAAITGKSVFTIRKWVRDGTLPAEKFPKTSKGHWYVKELDIPTYLRKHE